MNNVGENKTFILNGNTPTQPMRYVWTFWDNSTDVTETGTVSKQLNVGGNPADGYQVRFTCEAINEVGHDSSFNGAIVVNNPPSIVPGSSALSQDGADFQFHTVASLIAYDPESLGIGFQWFHGGQPIGGGTTSVYGTVGGTYAGTHFGDRTGYQNSIGVDVTSNGSLVCHVYDVSGGTTVIPFYVFGQSPAHSYAAPQITYFQTTIDASSDPNIRIGVAEYASFSVFTPAHSNPTDFLWTFAGTDGWAATTTSSGTTAALANGAFQSTALKLTYGETAGAKVAQCRILDEITKASNTVRIPCFLVANTPPVIVSSSVLPDSPVSGDIMSFEANGTDADGDIIQYRWNFTGLGVKLYGRKVFVDSSPIPAGQPVQASLTITDRLGLTATQVIQSQTLS